MVTHSSDIKTICTNGGALLGSAAGPVGNIVGGIIGGLLGEILERVAVDLSVEQAQRLLGCMHPLRNTDLERTVLDALRNALQEAKRELMSQTDGSCHPRGLAPDEEKLFDAWDELLEKKHDDKILNAYSEVPHRVPTLTKGESNALLDHLQKLAEPTAVPESLQAFLRARLPQLFQHHFTQVLKDPKHQRAWIAFQKQLLEAVFQLVGNTDAQVSYLRTLLEERIAKQQEQMLFLLEAALVQWDARAQQLTRNICEPILQAVDVVQQRLDYIVGLLGERHCYRLLHEAMLQFINSSTQELFIGREGILGDLERFITERRSGLAVLLAPAGYGKTRLMMRFLTRLQARGDTKTVYHFFTNHESLRGLGTRVEYAYAHLLLQLGALQGTVITLPDANPDELRAALYYQLKGLSKAQTPLVILIDALDEADEPIPYPPLPEPLPDGVFVIVSARWDGQPEPPPYLEAWHDRADQKFSLESLREDEVREWVAREQSLHPYAADAEFIRTLHQRTEGLPLYTRYLIDDLKDASDPREKLRDAPQGVRDYIRQQMRQLAPPLSNAQEVLQMFALLTVAKGALPEDDIQELCGLSVLFKFESLPQPIRRWFLRSEASWQFAHPLLAAEFRRELGKDAKCIERKLLEHCAQWRAHKSPYALRYYAAHLAEHAASDSTTAEQLYALMENEEFFQMQREAFPNQPELPLSQLQSAIKVALERDEPIPLAKLLLLHAKRVQGFHRQSPCQIWRETSNLEYALKIADTYHPRVRLLWYLLIAIEHHNPERQVDILDRLSGALFCEEYHADQFTKVILKRCITKLEASALDKLRLALPESDWLDLISQIAGEGYDNVASQLLEWLLTWGDLSGHQICSALSKLQVQLGLYDEAIHTAKSAGRAAEKDKLLLVVAEAQAQRGLFTDALATAEMIENCWDRSEALVKIVAELARAGMIEQAQRTVSKIYDPWLRSQALGAIVQAQAESGMFEDAFRTAKMVEDAWVQSEAVAAIAMTQALRKHFKEAVDTALLIGEPTIRVRSLYTIATMQARERSFEDAKRNFENAIINAKHIEETPLQLIILQEVAMSQAQVGLYSDALRTMQLVDDEGYQLQVLLQIAIAQSRVGQREDARKWFMQVLQAVQDNCKGQEQVRGLLQIALAQATAGFVNDARKTLQQAHQVALKIEDDTEHRTWLLCVALEQTKLGLFADAIRTTEALKQTEDKISTLCRIFEAQVHKGMPQDARDTFQQAMSYAQKIDDSWIRKQALEMIAISLASAGLTEESLYVAQVIEETRDWEQALRRIVISQAHVGLFEEALRNTQAIKPLRDRCQALSLIAALQARAGLFEDAYQVALEIGENRHQSLAFHAIACAKAERGSYSDAVRIAQQIEIAKERSITLTVIAEIAASNSRADEARNLLQEALQTTQEIDDVREKSIALQIMSSVQLGIGDLENALQTALSIEDGLERSLALVSIVSTLAQEGNVEHAYSVAQRISEVNCRNAALRRVIEAKAERGLLDDALQLTRQIQNTGDRVTTLAAIARVYLEMGKEDESLKLLHEALEVAKTIEEPLDLSAALRAIAEVQVQNKALLGDARANLTEALRAALSVESWRQIIHIAAIAKVQVKAGLIEDSLHTIQQIDSYKNRGIALCEIIVAQPSSEVMSKAVRIAEQLKDPSYDVQFSVIESLIQVGDHHYFKQLLPPAAYSLPRALRACAALIRAYPDQARAISEAVRRVIGS